MTSRRDFLIKALASATGLMAQQAFSMESGDFTEIQSSTPKEDFYDCIVIGAGIAGLSAAKDLAFPLDDKGRRVVVLEASNRIGGRVFTVKDPRFGGPIEMGGAYIHVNPSSFPLGKDIDNYDVPLEKIFRMYHGLIYYNGWEDNLRKEYEMICEWKISDLLSFAKEIDSYEGPDISARQWLNHKKYPPLGRNLVDLYFTGAAPGSLDQLSVKGFGADGYSNVEMGWYEYRFTKGYGHFLHQLTVGRERHLGKKMDIRFGKAVQHIKYNLPGVEVTTVDGQVFKAKSAIITVSVGMLKSGRVTFDPPLPQEKLDALSCLEMGDEGKMILKFKKRFWPEDAAFINRVDRGPKMSRTYFVPFSSHGEKNKVLAVLFAGDEADRIKNMSDMDLIQALCKDFDKMFPHAAPTYRLLDVSGSLPTYLRYQWSRDDFAMGADSYLKIGGEKSVPIQKARRKLARPHSTPGLFWAGEATATGGENHPGSTHGAHFTGFRAALEVDEHLRLKFPHG